MSRNGPFLFVPCQILLTQCPETFFGVQNASFCVQKASLSVRTGRVRMKIHSVPFFESSSLKTRFSSKSAKILDSKRRKKRSLETQGIYIHMHMCVSLCGVLINPINPLFLWRMTPSNKLHSLQIDVTCVDWHGPERNTKKHTSR